ncbi:hypothetical protein [Hymenobacter canadensis]|uniref:MerC domain-containing protein n=1 Tax=Hymenobacter canadensis TaxID=2999067 RepID=A0ABY7LQX0_9BACT|nr:hypothetical protein [Hymenobacter canadensis]WBA41994.1 hypothetical protein O3303_00180 [Hymenobacter canadensis]
MSAAKNGIQSQYLVAVANQSCNFGAALPFVHLTSNMAASPNPEPSKLRNLGALLVPGIFLLMALLKLFSQDYLAAGLWTCLSLGLLLLGQAQRRRWAFWAACAMLVLSLVFVYLKSRANRAAKQAQPAAASTR